MSYEDYARLLETLSQNSVVMRRYATNGPIYEEVF